RRPAPPSTPPLAALPRAQFLARHGRLGEALELHEKALAAAPPEVIAASCVTALDYAKPEAADLARADKILEAARKKAPKSPRVLMSLAALRSMQRDYAAAEELYREVLKRNENEALAMNNLAFLL